MADFIENCGVRGTSNCHKDEQILAKLQVLSAQVILMKCNQEIVIILPLSREKGVILLKCNQEIIVIILLLSTEKGILPVYRFLQLYPTIHWNSNDREMKTTE